MKAEILDYIIKYANLLGIDPRWRFIVCYRKNTDNAPDAPPEDQYAAACSSDIEYCRSDLEFDLEVLARGEEFRNLEAVVRHEMLHILLFRMQRLTDGWCPEGEANADIFNWALEEVTTALEKMPVWSKIR